jgi:glycosyltransferase involved in cell wall biosynthesis
MKIVFLIRALDYGGAERQLVVLSKELRKRGHDVAVAIFYSGGPLEKELLEADVRIQLLNKRGRWDFVRFMVRLIILVRTERPDILYSYLTDLVTMLLKPFFPRIKMVWGIRGSSMDFSQYDWLIRLSYRLSCRLSDNADLIIANSHTGRKHYIACGYPSAKTVTIPNGIETDRFYPDSEARRRVRFEWNIQDHDTLIGMVGRLDPMKDHPCFLETAALLAKERKDTRFVCVGNGPDHYRDVLQQQTKSLNLERHVVWVPAREDVSSFYNAFDLLVSSSAYGEGFSNVIAEAMACGVPCVVTNVGDSAWLVGDQGEVVPPKDSVALKKAIEKVLDQRPYSPAQIRLRIVKRFSAEKLVMDTERTLLTLLRCSALGAQ